MMEIIIKYRKDTGIRDEELYALVNESYRQWTEQVLETPGLHRTLEEFCRIISRATVSSHWMLERWNC